jgi:hypothetical protein
MNKRINNLAPLAKHIEWAAESAGLERIELFGLESGLDVTALADAMERVLDQATNASQQLRRVTISAFGDASNPAGPVRGRIGTVVVAPDRTQRGRLERVRDLLALSGWKLLGVITYPHGEAERLTALDLVEKASVESLAQPRAQETAKPFAEFWAANKG